MIVGPAKAALATGLAGGVVLAVGDSVAATASDPTVMLYSIAAGAMALVTLLVKDKISPPVPPTPPTSLSEGPRGKDLIDRLERLAYGVDEDRGTSQIFRSEVMGRLDGLQGRMDGLHAKVAAIEVGVESLHAHQEMLADESEVASWRSDANGQCIWASQALRDLVGYSFSEGFQGTNWINIYPHDEAAHIQARWADAVRTKSSFSIRTHYQHKDGDVFPVQLHAECLPDGSFRGIARKILPTAPASSRRTGD